MGKSIPRASCSTTPSGWIFPSTPGTHERYLYVSLRLFYLLLNPQDYNVIINVRAILSRCPEPDMSTLFTTFLFYTSLQCILNIKKCFGEDCIVGAGFPVLKTLAVGVCYHWRSGNNVKHGYYVRIWLAVLS